MQVSAHSHVSVIARTTDNQVLEIEEAGYVVNQAQADTISGKALAGERP